MFFSEQAKFASSIYDDSRSEYETTLKKAQISWNELQKIKKEVSFFLTDDALPFISSLTNKPEHIQSFIPCREKILSHYTASLKNEQQSFDEHVFRYDVVTPTVTRILMAIFGATMGATLVGKFGVGADNPPMTALINAKSKKEILLWMNGGSLIDPGYFRTEKKDKEICESLFKGRKRFMRATAGLNLFIKAFHLRNKEMRAFLNVSQQKLDILSQSAPRDFHQFNEQQKKQLPELIHSIATMEKVLGKTFRLEK